MTAVPKKAQAEKAERARSDDDHRHARCGLTRLRFRSDFSWSISFARQVPFRALAQPVSAAFAALGFELGA